MSEHICKSHNKSLLMYHLVFPAKYRRKVFSKAVEISLRDVCLEIGRRYEIHFIEIGMEADHVHFMVQSVPTYPVYKIVRIIKSITAREIFKRHKGIKKELWGAALWTSGYYANTVGQFASSEVIKKYVANQGREYKKLYSAQLKFDF
ncbi:MAG: IS200/IS605 family transposase [Gemmatimonadaceae bacterium 4484_173]|nr:MAG: IS200/IS605 family transposase [Gemmatimonadaceae bacterium 4484_173]